MGDLAGGALDPEGPRAETIADLWWLLLGIGTAVFVLVAALLAWALVRRPRAQGSDRASPHVSRWLIGGGVVLPLVVLVVVFGATVRAMREDPSTAPPGSLVIDVVGHRWWWEVRYPEEGVTTANELHLPVGRPVALRLTSADVIHSFWVPALAGKLDLLPDGTNTLVLQADEPGEHDSLCAEFCGLQHADHGLVVVAEPEAEFEAWVEARRSPAVEATSAAARRGFDVFTSTGCASCHAIAGTTAVATAGPDLTHLASRQSLGAGAVANTREDLAAWVTDPHTIKNGVEMPATALTPEELDDVLAYLESLE